MIKFKYLNKKNSNHKKINKIINNKIIYNNFNKLKKIINQKKIFNKFKLNKIFKLQIYFL